MVAGVDILRGPLGVFRGYLPVRHLPDDEREISLPVVVTDITHSIDGAAGSERVLYYSFSSRARLLRTAVAPSVLQKQGPSIEVQCLAGRLYILARFWQDDSLNKNDCEHRCCPAAPIFIAPCTGTHTAVFPYLYLLETAAPQENKTMYILRSRHIYFPHFRVHLSRGLLLPHKKYCCVPLQFAVQTLCSPVPSGISEM